MGEGKMLQMGTVVAMEGIFRGDWCWHRIRALLQLKVWFNLRTMKTWNRSHVALTQILDLSFWDCRGKSCIVYGFSHSDNDNKWTQTCSLFWNKMSNVPASLTGMLRHVQWMALCCTSWFWFLVGCSLSYLLSTTAQLAANSKCRI